MSDRTTENQTVVGQNNKRWTECRLTIEVWRMARTASNKMKGLLTTYLIVLSFAFISQSCDSRPDIIEPHAMDADFNYINPERDTLGIKIMCKYNILRSTRERIENEHGARQYHSHLLIPLIKSVSESVLNQYSAGEIYSYKRPEIEQKNVGRVKRVFASCDTELTDLS